VYSRWIGVDLDGTLADHYWPEKGPYDPVRIGDPIPAMVEQVKAWIAEGHEVRVFTARVGPAGSAPSDEDFDLGPIYRAIWAWTEKHIGTKLMPTCMKDYGMVELWDDRAVRVLHNTGARCCDIDVSIESTVKALINDMRDQPGVVLDALRTLRDELGAFEMSYTDGSDPMYARFCDWGARIDAMLAISLPSNRPWWCPSCETHVDPKDVTFEEAHDVRTGGCGKRVQPAPSLATYLAVENVRKLCKDQLELTAKDGVPRLVSPQAILEMLPA
jgi:hypothetical protein